jgi:hypothetical protein
METDKEFAAGMLKLQHEEGGKVWLSSATIEEIVSHTIGKIGERFGDDGLVFLYTKLEERLNVGDRLFRESKIK